MQFDFKLIAISLAILFAIIVIVDRTVDYINIKREQNGLFSNISEWSYKRFSRFFGKLELEDKDFAIKVKTIWELIILKKENDLEKIAELSNCTYEECILKIQYLKNKRKIGDYYIDNADKTIKRCTKEDLKLLKKYAPFIYGSHLQPNEIALKLPGATANNIDVLERVIIEELDYLDKKYIINGLNIDRVDNKIIYYSLEKHKFENDFVTITCANCGAINDVPKAGKARCAYCNTIVMDETKNI